MSSGGLDQVTRFLLAVAAVLFVCHLLGLLARRFRQPSVIGEILGGLVLGPSVLGGIWPAAQGWLFPPGVVQNLGLTAQLGLVTFMFLLGCQVRIGELANRRRAITAVVGGAMGLPFIAGVVIALGAAGALGGTARKPPATALFFGIALAITALPVLARILVDLGLTGTPVGMLALACAAFGDALTWSVLAALLGAMSLAGSARALTAAAFAVGLVAITVFVIRPALTRIMCRAQRWADADHVLLPVLVTGAIAFAAATQLIGLHPVIGAFLFGTVVPRDSSIVERINHRLQGFAITVLLPLFFATVGLNTFVGLLGASATRWWLFIVTLSAAITTKFGGAAAGALLTGISGREILRLGALMNCRGVTELVVATIGMQYHLVSDLGLTILVLVALITTLVTGPIVRALSQQPTALENPVPHVASA
jgi:Kef-type K+ transport system membrane component KefB